MIISLFAVRSTKFQLCPRYNGSVIENTLGEIRDGLVREKMHGRDR